MTGVTYSSDFPTTVGIHDTGLGGSQDAFVTKLNPTGTSLIYSTFLGGNSLDEGRGITVDASGNAYVTGVTYSSDFPTTLGAFDTSYGAIYGYEGDAFVVKLDVTGSNLFYSTFFGGVGGDYANSIAVDGSGNAYLTGLTIWPGIPTTPGAFDTSFNGVYDAFVAKLDSTGSSLLYSTLLGSNRPPGGTWPEGDWDEGLDIAVDGSGNIFMMGVTRNPNFPTTLGAFDTSKNDVNMEGFVIKLSPSGNGAADLLYSTFLGGDGGSGGGMAVDGSGNIYVTGSTSYTGFLTTTGAYDTSFNGWADVFVVKLTPSGGGVSDLLYSTLLGGGGNDGGLSIAVDSSGDAYVTGYTGSLDFPTTTGAIDFPTPTDFTGGMDAFVIKLMPSGGGVSDLLYSTYFSLWWNFNDEGTGIAVDRSGNAYITGNTRTPGGSADGSFTTTGTYDTSFGGPFTYNGSDAFVAKVSLGSPNTPPVANAGTDQTVNVGTLVTLYGSTSSDPNGDPLTYNWTITSKPTGSTATLSDTTVVNPTFTVDKAGTYVVSLTVNDGTVDSAADTVTISTLNSAPVANAGAGQSVFVGNTVTLDGSGSTDVDGNLLTYSWAFTTRPSGSTATLSDTTIVNPTFTVDKAGTYVVSLIVNDGTVNSTADTVTISTLNSAPVANAGSDQSVYVGNTVTLDGSGSTDVDGNLLTYSWAFTTIPTGSMATLANPTSVNPTFVVDKAGTYVVSLIVNDGTVNSTADTVTISTLNSAPVSNAGPDQSVYVNNTVTLDGSGSTDVDGNLLTYSWAFTTIPTGSMATLANPTSVNPTFVVDKAGTYVVSLIVNDGTVNSSADTVTISTLNSAPVSNAGPDQSVFVNDTVTLDGSGSTDVDGNLLTYTWAFTTRPDGSTAALSNTAAVNPTFTVDKAGTYVVSLIVNDGTVNSVADTVTISTLNSAPVANAGADQSAYVGNTVTLDGSGSTDVDGNLLTYTWAFTTRPQDSNATLNDAAAVNPTFTVDKAGTYVVSLFVNDGTVNSETDTVTISTLNSAPVASAGVDQSAYVNAAVTLDGSGSSDVDGNLLTYSWAFTTKPSDSSATLSDSTGVNPTFTVDKAGTYVASLTVNDGTVNSETDTVTISTINVAPVASAGTDQSITVIGTTVLLDGSQSYDPDGDSITYQWSFISIPSGSNASLANGDTATPTFTADVHGDYIVQLVVNDASVQSSPDTVTISFENIKPVADAGTSQSVNVGDTVTLDGSGSTDGNGDSLTYTWTFSSLPDGSLSEIANPSAMVTTFVPDKSGTYVVQLVVNDGTVDSDPSTVQIQAVDTLTAAIQAIQDCEAEISSLDFGVFKNANMQNTLINKLNAVIANIEAGNYADALGQLQNDILGKTDGCATADAPDKNDWIKNCDAQGSVYPCLLHSIELVEALM